MKHTWIRALALCMALLLLVPVLVGYKKDGNGGEDDGAAQALEGENVKDMGGIIRRGAPACVPAVAVSESAPQNTKAGTWSISPSPCSYYSISRGQSFDLPPSFSRSSSSSGGGGATST